MSAAPDMAHAAVASLDALTAQVRAAETAFAATMAARDHDAFGAFLAEEAVFFNARGPLRGAATVKEAWRRFFTEPAAPFSWRPETVEVLDSGTLALTAGPVFDPQGRHVADFQTIWRLEPDGKWRVVFDRGNDVCEAAAKP
ncbi:MAG: nuclear transport factor 2 family protein [bacterium]|nr:nuclear transport factor 2 family protein [bacterium]